MATIGTLISTISSLAAKLLPGASSSSSSNECHAFKKELNKLMKTLKRIKVTLHDAEEREIIDESVKLWLHELKQVAYAAEDVLDEYQYEVLRAKVESRVDSAKSSGKEKKIELPDDLADRIKETMNRLDEIVKDRVALQLREDDWTRHRNDKMHITPTSHMVFESNIIGRENEKEELINLLCSDSNGDAISVVSIVGMGGLGKTTLAQLLYNDRRIRQKFDQFGWVCVSNDFSVERLTKEIMESITRSGCDVNNLSVLQEKLKKEIEGKSFFLVLDDVWNEKRSIWESFRIPFSFANLVKILVTTRNEPVARIMQTVPSFYLSYLTKEQCWQLFHQYAFAGVNCNEEWKLKIGKQIMKKCGMLPLAIKVIASLLRHEESEESWRDILESELWELEATKEIFPPLQISYLRLPTYLKPCWIYCSMFPKDYEFYLQDLTPLWHAQGFIELKGKKTIKEIGQEYAKQLFERSFFESKWGLPHVHSNKLKLHDLIHDLARSNSRNECYSIEYGKPLISPKQICHLYVNASHELVIPFPSSSFTALRTLITGNKVKNVAIISDISKTYSLRAVELKSPCYEFGFLHSLGYMKHLRYISLHNFTFKKLPESICSLYNLQTLSLDTSYDLIELPNNIGSLVSLQFLFLSKCSVTRLPDSICYLENLKSLIIYGSDLVELPKHIGNLVSLEELLLKVCRITILPASLCRLKSLKTLELASFENLEKLPRKIERLTKLQTLSISKFSCLPPSLNKLTGIQKLNLELTMSNTHDEFGWLNDIVDLKGTLFIDGLNNVTASLANSKHLNLMNMHNLECLTLSWSTTCYYPAYSCQIRVHIKNGGNDESPGCEMNLFLLGRFQPHPSLKNLDIIDYCGITFPKWIGDPCACASLEKVSLQGCKNLVFLPFSNLQNLKDLQIISCDSLQFIQVESVPPQLEKLSIFGCKGIISIPGIRKLESLAEFKICNCRNLKSLLKEPEPSPELGIHTDDSFYHMLSMGLTNLTSLQFLEIEDCPKLRVMADELHPIESCKVKVRDCPHLRKWCMQHNFTYRDYKTRRM